MGTKYTTTSVSGYNSSPPSDDNSATEANKIKWATIKTKLPDPLKTAIEAIDAKIVTWSDYGPTDVNATTILDSGDNEMVVVAATAVTLVLPDASAVGAGYRVYLKNSSASSIVIDRTTGTDTIDGVADDSTLAASEGRELMVNASANGFITLTSHGSSSGGSIPSGTRMLFQQSAAPAGWVKDTSSHNDKALRVVTGTVSSGGATAFTSVFGSGKTSGSTAISIANLPGGTIGSFSGSTSGHSADHTHGAGSLTSLVSQGGGGEVQGADALSKLDGTSYVPVAGNTGGASADHYHTYSGSVASAGSGTGHTHTVSLDLQYADVIIATKS